MAIARNKSMADTLAKMLKRSTEAAASSVSQTPVLAPLTDSAGFVPMSGMNEGSTMPGLDNGLQFQNQMGQIMEKKKALNMAGAEMNPPGPVDVRVDPRRAYLAAGLGLLGALLNKGSNGTRQAGFGAMQNILNGAERERQDKANKLAARQSLDFQAKLRKHQADLANLGMDESALIMGENQKAAQAKAANDQEWKQKEYDLKVKTSDETIRRNMANEEIARYKATPEFSRNLEALKRDFPKLPQAMLEAMVLAPFEENIAKVFNLKARTADTLEQTRLRPIVAENNFNLRQALINQRGSQFEQTFGWQKQNDIANRFMDQQKIDNDAAAKAAQAAQAEAKYPSYGGMTREQQSKAAKAKIESLAAEFSKMGVSGDGMLSKAAIATNPRLKKLMDDYIYWKEVLRKISVGERLSRDPWAPPGLANQQQSKGGNAPLLPQVGNLQVKPSLFGPIGK